MKGKNKFTAHEALAILGLLGRKREHSQSRQKFIRDTLRSKGFYMSNYGQNLTPAEFDNLVSNGKIIITEHSDFYNEQKLGYFTNTKLSQNPTTSGIKNKKPLSKDEHYILDLCDDVLKHKSVRQHKFDWLLGDPNEKDVCIKLPVDAYFPELKLVIEYKEKQHTESVNFFDKPDKMTVSGVSRGEQRKIYDQRRKDLIPKNGLRLIELSYEQFSHNSNKRLLRNQESDKKVISTILAPFIYRSSDE